MKGREAWAAELTLGRIYSRYGTASVMTPHGRQWGSKAWANTERCKAKARRYFDRVGELSRGR